MKKDLHAEDYQSILDTIHDAIIINDLATGRIVDVNAGMCALYQCTYEEATHATIIDYSANEFPYTAEEAGKWIEKTLAEGPQTFEWRAKKGTGEPFWTEVTLKRLALGGEDRILAVIHDISDRKQMESRVAAQVQQHTAEMLDWRRRYEQLSELSGMITYTCSPSKGTIVWGKTLPQILGYDPTQIENTVAEWKSWLHPDDREVTVRQIENAGHSLNTYDVTYRLRHKNGNYIYVRDRGYFYIDENGETIPEMVGLMLDITDSRLLEESLLESESRFKGLIQQSPFALEIYELDGTMSAVNHAWEELYQTTAENAVGKFNILTDEQSQKLGLPFLIRRVIAGEYIKTGEFQFAPAQSGHEGRARWLVGHFYPLRNNKGEVVNIVSSEIDITERKEVELKQERLQRQIIEAQQHALKELATPIIPVLDQIIVMPLIGSIDSLRAKDLMRNLLEGINRYRAKIVILDVTGVPILDSGVANHLNQTIRAAQLKGTRAIITGISDAVAETIVDLGIDWTGVETLSDLQTGLIAALHTLGLKIGR